MSEPTDFVQRSPHAVIRAEVAVDDVFGLRRRMGRPFAVEAHLRVVFSDAINKRTADPPTTAGDNEGRQNVWLLFFILAIIAWHLTLSCLSFPDLESGDISRLELCLRGFEEKRL